MENMYYSLYRKYRPLKFSDVVGQDHITRTLLGQLVSGQVGHAYLFTGTRGTGKTTCAKLFARAVNCLNPQNGEPCNECEICKGLLAGNIFDVEEIDAASNNSVDNIRQLRDEIVYTPTVAKKKVYIIDEVHMLSSNAFNALLKTLEEPPSHALFILATTEAHKVPATILSRCQRFDFMRINNVIIKNLIKKIVENENKTIEDRALDLVVSMADGSMRDGLSIVEKVLDLGNIEAVEQALGLAGNKALYEIIDYIADENTEAIYFQIQELYKRSKDLGLVCADISELFRMIAVIKTVKNHEKLIEKSTNDLEILQNLAKKYTINHIIYAQNCLQQTMINLSKGINKRTETELCLLKIAKPQINEDFSSLVVRIEKLENALQNQKTNNNLSDENVKKIETYIKKPDKAPQISAETSPLMSEPEELSSIEPLEMLDNLPIKAVEKIDETEEKKTEEPKIINKTEKTVTEGDYTELQIWYDACNIIFEKEPMLGAMLRDSHAVYGKNEIIIICMSTKELPFITKKENMEIIKTVLSDYKKSAFALKVVAGKLEDYIIDTTTYDNVSENGMFSFEK